MEPCLPQDGRSRSPSLENDVFAISAALVPPQAPRPASTVSVSFDNLLDPPLLLHEDLSKGCGGQLWPAGMTLAKYILTYHKDTFRDKSIIEIGAGGGLVGLTVAAGCPSTGRLLITDQAAMLSLMEKNVALNSLESKVQTQVYNWATPVPAAFQDRPPDIVLAADCVYFEPAFPLLLQTLVDLIGPETICYFCFKKRRKADMRFLKDMQKRFACREIEYGWREQDRRERVHLLEVRRE